MYNETSRALDCNETVFRCGLYSRIPNESNFGRCVWFSALYTLSRMLRGGGDSPVSASAIASESSRTLSLPTLCWSCFNTCRRRSFRSTLCICCSLKRFCVRKADIHLPSPISSVYHVPQHNRETGHIVLVNVRLILCSDILLFTQIRS